MIVWLASSAAQAACTVITGATVHLETGPAAVSVTFAGDEIVAVGAAPAGGKWRGEACTAVDGTGKVLTAGLVAAPTQVGLVEIGLEPSSRNDDPQTPEDPIRAALYAADGYDPLSTLVRVTRMDGITSAVTVPGGGFVSGYAAVVALDGQTQADALVRRDAALVASVPTASFAEGMQRLRELVSDVRAYAARPSSYDTSRPFAQGASKLDLDALRPAVDGRVPILVDVDKASELEALIRLQAELRVKFIVRGGAEAWLVADALAKAKIPVIIDPLVYGPQSFDETRARRDNAALLQAAGVPLVIGPAERTHNVRSLRETAGNAVREGLDHAAALTAITKTPAAAFGAPDRGRVAVGAVADLALWTGDPLELSSAVAQEWIEGRPVELRSRQTELFEKYRTLPGTPAPALPVAR